MSGFLINEELREVERRLNLELGHASSNHPEGQASEYYPQFEGAVREEAARMSKHYEVFYCLEISIRKLVSETLTDAFGADWWNSSSVPQRIQDDVLGRVQKELDSGVTRRSDDLLNYTTFGELSVLITTNWVLFEPIFNSRRAVERIMSSLNLLRGPIAHCCPISDDEVDRLRLTVKDWFRTMA
jgi:hypothetical protein